MGISHKYPAEVSCGGLDTVDVVGMVGQVNAVRADVADSERKTGDDFTLNVETPLLDVAAVWIRLQRNHTRMLTGLRALV